MSQSVGYSGRSQNDWPLFMDLVRISSEGCLNLTEVDNKDRPVRKFQPCVIKNLIILTSTKLGVSIWRRQLRVEFINLIEKKPKLDNLNSN